MIIKTINITFDLLVAFTVWCAAVLFAIMGVQAMVIGAVTAYHLLNS